MTTITPPATGTAWFAGVPDARVAADIRSALADGVLSFADVRTIAQNIAARGTITSDEVTSLKALLTNANLSFAADDYAVQTLDHFIFGDFAANPAGNPPFITINDLHAGLTGAQAAALVATRFGASEPNANFDPAYLTDTVSYKLFSAPLFAAGGPSISDVRAGLGGDTDVAAVLISMLVHRPDQLASMFRDNGDGTWGVRLYLNGNEVWETVDAQLPVDSTGLVYMGLSGGATTAGDPTSLWAELAEKALAQLKGGYANLNDSQLSTPNTAAFTALTDAANVAVYRSTAANWSSYKAAFINAVARGDDVVVEAHATLNDANGVHIFSNGAAYAVIGYDAAADKFILRSPYGDLPAGVRWPQFEASMSDIAGVQGQVVVDDAATHGFVLHDRPNAPAVNTIVEYVSTFFMPTNSTGRPVTQYMFIGGTLLLNGATNLASASQQAQGITIVSAADLPRLITSPNATWINGMSVAAGDGQSWSELETVQPTVGNVRVVGQGEQVALTDLVSFGSAVDLTNPATTLIVSSSAANGIQLNGATNLSTTGASVKVSGADFAKLTATAGTVSIGYGLLPTTTGPSLIPTLHIAIQTGASVDAAIQLFDNGQVSPTNIPGVADTAAQVFGHLDAMQALVDANALWAVHVTDTATAAVSLSATHAAADLGALSITSGHYALTIADSASNVVANLDALQALAGGGHLAQIDATGAVNITAAQWQADGDAVARISATGPITAALSGAHTQYTVAQGSSGLTISGNGVTESLGNVDRVAFSDGYLAFDIHGDAGQAYRLYQAAFNRVPDVAGLGFNIHSLDVGLSLADVAQQFISSAEFQHTYGNPDDDAWVTLLYQNVLHRAPEQAGFAFHLWELSVGLTRAQQLAEFSESPENQANVIGQIQNGIFYTLPAS